MLPCPICENKKVLLGDKTVKQCVCVRQDYIRERISKKVCGEIKFKKPEDLLKFEVTVFIEVSLQNFRDYLAGYLLHKINYTFEIMTVPEYFTYRMEHNDNKELHVPDLVVLNFSSIFVNKVAPLFVIQLCEERATLGKKTWLISSVNRSDLEHGFREGKEFFNDFLYQIPFRKYTQGKFKTLKAKKSDTPEEVSSWRNGL